MLSTLRGKVLSPISDSNHPGQIALTRMRAGPSSTASFLAKVTCAALEAAYTDDPVTLNMRVPCTEEQIAIEPPARLRCGTEYLTVRKVPLRLMSMVASHSSGVISSTAPTRR